MKENESRLLPLTSTRRRCRFCEEYGIANAYTDMQIMLDEQKPNLVHVCTPPSTHFELCVKALRHGSHVICEKPLVGSLDEVDRLQALERETGLTCSTIFQWRFGSSAQHLRAAYRYKCAGPLTSRAM